MSLGRACACALVVLALAAPATAASPEQLSVDVSRAVMSPFCPGVTLHDCPSPAAERLRRRIEGWARDGAGRSEIMARLEAEYGPGIHGAPPRSGVGLAVWIVPGVLLCAGAGIAVVLARRWTRPAASPAATPLTPVERRRLDEEVARLREV